MCVSLITQCHNHQAEAAASRLKDDRNARMREIYANWQQLWCICIKQHNFVCIMHLRLAWLSCLVRSVQTCFYLGFHGLGEKLILRIQFWNQDGLTQSEHFRGHFNIAGGSSTKIKSCQVVLELFSHISTHFWSIKLTYWFKILKTSFLGHSVGRTYYENLLIKRG